MALVPSGWPFNAAWPGDPSLSLKRIGHPDEMVNFADTCRDVETITFPTFYWYICASHGDTLSRRHSNGGNVTYYDGHAGWVSHNGIYQKLRFNFD